MIQRLSPLTINQRFSRGIKNNPLPQQKSESPRFGMDPNIALGVLTAASGLAAMLAVVPAATVLALKVQFGNLMDADKPESEKVDELIRLIDNPPKYCSPFKTETRCYLFNWAGPYIESDSDFQRLLDAISKYHSKAIDASIKAVKESRLYAKFRREHAEELE